LSFSPSPKRRGGRGEGLEKAEHPPRHLVAEVGVRTTYPDPFVASLVPVGRGTDGRFGPKFRLRGTVLGHEFRQLRVGLAIVRQQTRPQRIVQQQSVFSIARAAAPALDR